MQRKNIPELKARQLISIIHLKGTPPKLCLNGCYSRKCTTKSIKVKVTIIIVASNQLYFDGFWKHKLWSVPVKFFSYMVWNPSFVIIIQGFSLLIHSYGLNKCKYPAIHTCKSRCKVKAETIKYSFISILIVGNMFLLC